MSNEAHLSHNALMMSGISECYHVTPLHYLPYICTDGRLLSKEQLRGNGFADTHFRTTSFRTDERRGFSNIVHCMSCARPPLLVSKLKLGYSHVVLAVPVHHVSEAAYTLCRYNIARNRGRFAESDVTGRLRSSFKIPVAGNLKEKSAMLRRHRHSCLEILFRTQLRLPEATIIDVFNDQDAELASTILRRTGRSWQIRLVEPPVPFRKDLTFTSRAIRFAQNVMDDPNWKGFPLEFDR